MALGKRKGMIMNTPDKKQPRKHFFKIPVNFYELSEKEQDAWTLQIAKVIHWEANERDIGHSN
jgi:hypothetical protein